MLVFVRSFSYTAHADHSHDHCFSLRLLDRREISFSSCWIQTGDVFLLDCSCNHSTETESQMLCLDQTKTQEQGLPGYSSVRLTSRASHRLGKCRLSWVWLGFGLLSALSECSACLGRGSHRHASSGFVFGTDWPDSSVLTWPRPYICLFCYFFLFTLIVLF